MDKNKFKGRPFGDDDIRTIVEEVTYLMEHGYRAHDREQVLEGLEVAIEGSPKDDWKRWTGMKLRNVIEDLYYLGTP